jgi:hypothetical protein
MDTPRVPDQLAHGAISERPTDDDLALIYDVAWRKAATFFEWRHKVMTFTVAAVGAGIVAAGWLLDKNASQYIVGGLLLFLAGLVVTTWMMDQRVSVHMRDAYEVGSYVEQILTGGGAERGRLAHQRLPLGALLDRRRHGSSAIAKSGDTSATSPTLANRLSSDSVASGPAKESPQPDGGSLTAVLSRAYVVTAVVLAISGILIAAGGVALNSGDGVTEVEIVQPAK